MKIYNKVVIDLKSGKVIEEDSFEYEGQLALCGGGGNAGSVSIDADIKAMFRMMIDNQGSDVLTISLFDLIDTATSAGGNPFEDEEAFDPNTAFTPADDSPIKRMSDGYDSIRTEIDSFNSIDKWQSYIDAAYAKLDKFATIDFLTDLSNILDSIISDVNTALNGSGLSDAVDSYRSDQIPAFMRSIGRFAAGMSMSNAVMSSAYVMGLAWREYELEKKVDGYEKDLRFRLYSNMVGREIASYLSAQVARVQSKDQMVLGGSQIIAQLDDAKHTIMTNLAQLRADIQKLIIIAETEHEENQLKIDEAEARWDFEAFTYGANLLGSAQGAAAFVPRRPSKLQSALSGFFGGAAKGAQIGFSMGNPVLGGFIGGMAGLGMGLLE